MVRPVLATLSLAVAAAAGVAAGPPAAAGGGCHRPGVTDARTTVVDMRHNCFTPVVARVDVGDTVVFRNGDPVPHTVTGTSAAPLGGGRQLAASEELRHVFDAPGVFPYSCVLHPGMLGAVVVGDGVPAEGVALEGVRAAAPAPPAPPDVGADAWPWLVAAGALAATGAGVAARRPRRSRRR